MSAIITKAEVKKHRHRNSLWLIIHDEVYDVTKYLEEHPGGEDVLLDAAGSDATQAFEDVGHSEDAREVLKKHKIGKLPDDEKSKASVPVCCMTAHRMSKRDGSRRSSVSGKSSCSDCTSVSSCVATNRPQLTKAVKSWQKFDTPNNSNLTSKSSKTTRFVVPPDICDEEPSSTGAASKIVCDKANSKLPKTKKRNKRCDKKRERGLPCDSCGGSYWKWLALAAFLIGAAAVGAMVVKKNS